MKKELNEKAEWLNCPKCGSSSTEFLNKTEEMEKYSEENEGTKVTEINYYECRDCGCKFTKNYVTIKYNKVIVEELKPTWNRKQK